MFETNEAQEAELFRKLKKEISALERQARHKVANAIRSQVTRLAKFPYGLPNIQGLMFDVQFEFGNRHF